MVETRCRRGQALKRILKEAEALKEVSKLSKENQALVDAAKAHLSGKVVLEAKEFSELLSKLKTAAGYRLFTKSHICHGVKFYPTEEKAIMAGMAVELCNERIIGGLYHGMKCGRDSNFDHIDKQYGLVFGVTVA